MKNKIIKSILTLVMIVGVFATVNNISIEEVKAATNAADAPDDWAFTEASIPLHDAILDNYGAIDKGDGKGGSPDGYISISEANAYNGTISLFNMGITGTLDGIENFTKITEIRLYDNNLEGEIPSGIGSITSLRTLQLHRNQLTGEIPSELSNLSLLQNIRLSGNKLTGSIPEEIYEITSLTYLDLASNQLTGGISSNVSKLTKLNNLTLSGNQLTGEIPSGIGYLTGLTALSLHTNQLSGSIPKEIGSLTLLTKLELYNNQLSGEIPSEIGTMVSLTEVQLYNNQLTGEIPREIGNLTQLTKLRLYNNQLTGEIPSEIGKLTLLTDLQISNNKLIGEIPKEIGNLTQLTRLELHTNQLTGDVPVEIGNLKLVTRLEIHNNQLTGISTSALSEMTSLNVLHCHFNNFSTVDLTGVDSLTALTIGKATNANLGNATYLYVTGSKPQGSAIVRLLGLAGAFEWDATTGYYVINPGMNATYAVGLPYTDASGNINMIISSTINLSEGGLMDNEGNLIVGANLTNVDVATGSVILQDGGTVVTGEATYVFDKATTVGGTDINTEGNITIIKNTTDGSTVSTSTTTIIKTPESSESTITLDGSGGITNVPAGSIVTTNDGSETYLTGNGSVTDAGVIISSDIMVTVPTNKVNDISVDGNEVTFPSGVIVDDGSTSIVYPGTIIYDTDDNTLTYLPVDGLFNENGTLKDEVTQEDITNSQNFVTGLEDSNLKTELQNKVDEAQRLFNEREAQKAVDDLFDDEDILNDDVTQDDIKNAQDLVNKLPEGDLKNELNDRLKDAQKQLDERNFVIIEAFKVFTGEGSVYTKIDAPMEKFSKLYVDGKELDASNYEVTSGSTVITLTEAYLKTLENGTHDVDVEFTSGAVVSTELTVKVTFTHPNIAPPATTNPTPGTPTVSKPSTDVGSTTNSSSVNTSDATDLMGLYAMLTLSILGIVVIRKRKEA